jgi:hypothetical protein
MPSQIDFHWRTGEHAMTTAADPASPAVANWTTGMTSTADTLQACTEACVGWQQEICHFLDLRWAHNRRSWQALMKARNLPDIVKVQQDWILETTDDYSRQAVCVTQLATTISLTGTAPAIQAAATPVA